MNILAVSSTEEEISELRKHLSIHHFPHPADILIAGVGSIYMAHALTRQLQKKKYDVAFNFGICGSFSRNIEIGSIVNVVRENFADLGAEDGDNFLSLTEIGLNGSGEVINESSIDNAVLKSIPKVSGITMNKIHGSEKSIEKTVSRLNPQTESMEGGAFLYCCMSEGIPCAQIRAISNYVERRNKNSWNIPLAVENLNRKAIEILEAFKS